MTGTGGDENAVGDAVDAIQREWHRLRPDLDLSAIGIVGRVLRSAALIVHHSDEVLAAHGLTRGEFDILAALRRSAAPRSPGELRTISLATAPSTTKRLKQLEARGLVHRATNPADGRGALIALTAAGRDLADEVFPLQLSAENSLIAGLEGDESAVLERSLTRLLASIERS
ncbi:MarR family winged helix-turn-helix transcriptional regulator [Agreia pratensis]|uniref:DNA-binding transcriptional regulator, MarR family n=1 Tax=Agreia pratensis TaxID=150121 RepID=A0A1X7L108_9MICO|nr:MarR family transcriptional regulator [Agreia pratensis]SMG47123.1 DNA-binding transcriptional regulator, MarR family [Agreia pratensis]